MISYDISSTSKVEGSLCEHWGSHTPLANPLRSASDSDVPELRLNEMVLSESIVVFNDVHL